MYRTSSLIRIPTTVMVALALAGSAGCRNALGGDPADGPTPEPPRISNAAEASLEGDQLTRIHARRVEEMLRGRFAGVSVVKLANGDFSVQIRGAASLTGRTEPLFVIDGMPVESGMLVGINPADVARIDVIKDATASSYGVRGANGVVLITTKRDE